MDGETGASGGGGDQVSYAGIWVTTFD
jgi:hypothetical protein